MELFSSPSETYLEYLFSHYPDIDANILSFLESIFDNTNWNNPETSTDWNNLAVIDLIEAEQSENLELKANFIQSAKENLERGFSIDQSPHCAAHYVLIQSMLGEDSKAVSLALNTAVNLFQPIYTSSESISTVLIYLPLSVRRSIEFESILNASNGYAQALMLLAEVLWRSQFIFYNSSGIRFLRLANQLAPDSPTISLMLGIAELMSGQVEGLVHLHHAIQLHPLYVPILQALYLGYRGIGDLNKSRYWLEAANNIRLNQNSDTAAWQWTQLALESKNTYVDFEKDLVLSIEPSFHSIVTTVLVAQGDWFEREMEFWRNGIKAGMTVIDVGANAGVYTFSAAKRVGSTGLVLAIEPFSQCVAHLNETCLINQLDWVKVCAGAASDRNGRAKLSLSSASELNELISEEDGQARDESSVEEVECFTLDSLIEKYGVSRVDFLKIDAEGHELQVLKGSDRLLTEFKPIILYENIAGSQGSNLPVADFLRSIGYQLFRYQPYLQKLISVDVNGDFQNRLNIIALPQRIIIQ
ncbi:MULTISPECIES: FkbM family methyltransferase [Pseudanabaena]|uniref:Methyltransferase FkbM family n=2 Tax=Pseudanabaena TaxID=1152 RepID=L8N0F1_9CYAN|nr:MULTISPECIES: FkbM family methyltransferase [Pseudanabaena]ELS33692.1 methyltransferase FkbM family [Pseudanabaena biceps PCC 7429]MDG3494085.1 FkbM family methyltransferase [Pseudanabaena catenata USMAC16]